ncbi:MAG: hypothetical protein J6R20_06070 [Clostridia bacterium]|nr:hypothetical protein [Clostridia bacterium]
MTLKKSSVDTFRFTYLNTMKKNCLIPILVFIFNMIFQLYTPIIRYYNLKYTGSLGLGLDKIVYAFTNPSVDFFGVIFGGGLLLCPFVTAALIYKYMMNKSAVNVYFSLGVKRTSMFFAKFTAGLTMVIGAQVIPFVSALIANLLLFGSHEELWRSFFFILLNYIVIEIFVFAVTAATFSLVGTVVEGLAFSFVYGLSPAVIAVYIGFLFQRFLVGSVDKASEWSYTTNNLKILGVGVIETTRTHPIDFVSDFLFFPYSSVRIRYMLVEGPYSWYDIDYRPLLFWTLVTALIVILGWIAFKNRKVEVAGFMGSNQKATFAFTFLIAMFLSSTLLPELIAVDSDFGITTLVILTILLFLIIYFVIEMISLRSVKKFFKYFWKYPIHLAIYFLGVVIFATGFFGHKTRIPAFNNIESVSIQTETGDLLISPTNIGYKDYYWGTEGYYLPTMFMTTEDRDFQLVGGFDSEEDIKRAVDIHKMLIEVSDDKVNSETVTKPYGERVRPVSITIVYHLKNGKTFQRNYYVANDEILCKLAEFTESERYKELVLDSFAEKSGYMQNGETDLDYVDDLVGYETVHSDNYQIGFASPNLTKITPYFELSEYVNLKTEVLNAVEQDIRDGNLPLNLSSKEKVVGYIVLKNFMVNTDGITYNPDYEYSYETDMVAFEVVEDKAVAVQETYFSVNDTNCFSIPVYENMTNTLKFINENGFAEYFVDEKKPYAVKLWNGVSDFDDNRLYVFSNKTMLFCGTHFYPTTEETSYMSVNLSEDSQVVTEPELIAEYQDKAQLLYLTCYDGVYAQFLFEDGSSTFAYIPK